MEPLSFQIKDEHIIGEREEQALAAAQRDLQDGTGAGSEWTGWVKGPRAVNASWWSHLQSAADSIREHSEILVVIGVGGSYLGARAAIEALQPLMPAADRGVEVVYAGHHLSMAALVALRERLQGKRFSINVISKSGTTLEPALAFRYIRAWRKEGLLTGCPEDQIYITTDAGPSVLRKLAEERGYQTFIVPDDIGGRYSVMTPVGFLPMAAAGIDIDAVVAGAEAALKDAETVGGTAGRYAMWRQAHYRLGKKIEILAQYEPGLEKLGGWWQQLFGESEGKNGKGIFPVSSGFTTDLHALGQYIQDGERHLIETHLFIKQPAIEEPVPSGAGVPDGLDYLESWPHMHAINEKAYAGTVAAHRSGDVPVARIEWAAWDAYHLGYAFYLFQYACGLGGYMLGVNPFDQPGVESYKQHMFDLLGKSK
jgi:glucose-6-phosphate isomerase